jgi:hypothetical protein
MPLDEAIRAIVAEMLDARVGDMEAHVQALRCGDVTVSEARAGELLGISGKTLANLRVSGGGPPFVEIGARIVYRPADLDEWAKTRRRKSTTEAQRFRPTG